MEAARQLGLFLVRIQEPHEWRLLDRVTMKGHPLCLFGV